jgi:DMSO/TMAO reductase YedYZ molybdopterin-dependent catalytic subunit
MKNYLRSAIALLTFLCCCTVTWAQPATEHPVVKITGELRTPMVLSIDDLARFTQINVTRKDHDGKDYTYKGVPLEMILQKAGVTLGKNLRGKNLAKYVLIEAADGYKVVFALAELDEEFTDRPIILATEIDGKPVPAAEGPFRIIVQGEKKPARCIKQVIAIKVLSAS